MLKETIDRIYNLIARSRGYLCLTVRAYTAERYANLNEDTSEEEFTRLEDCEDNNEVVLMDEDGNIFACIKAALVKSNGEVRLGFKANRKITFLRATILDAEQREALNKFHCGVRVDCGGR